VLHEQIGIEESHRANAEDGAARDEAHLEQPAFASNGAEQIHHDDEVAGKLSYERRLATQSHLLIALQKYVKWSTTCRRACGTSYKLI